MKIPVKIAISIIITILLLCSCSNSNQNNSKSENEEPDIDLSLFENHGDWSDGLIWCLTSHDDWKNGTTYTFAYYNEQGTKVSRDFDTDVEYASAEEKIIAYDSSFTHYIPHDSSNGWVFILDNYDSVRNGNCYLIYSSKGFDFVGKIYCSQYSEKKDIIYFVGAFEKYADKYKLCALNKNGSQIEFELPEDLDATYITLSYDDDEDNEIGDLKIINKFYLLRHWYSTEGIYHNYLFDKNGKLKIDFTKTELVGMGIKNVEIKSENEYEIIFNGQDSQQYKCTMDLKGNIIKQPTAE